MPLHNISRSTTLGFFNEKTLGYLSSGFPVFQILNYRNPEIIHLTILFVIWELEGTRILAYTLDIQTLNPQNDLMLKTDHDQ
jgi:hypothetical protein